MFWFKDNETLVVFYSYKGYDRARILKEGFHVNYFKANGKIYKSAIEIKKDVWTKYLNKAIFEKDYEKIWERIPKNPEEAEAREKTKQKTSGENINTEQKTISIEEMQKELERLKNMLDKKLITKEEYEMLKKNVLKKAGL
ncbi:hypothetical protein TTHT_2229 [Thermotomaculum hydrothermale]|uniref:SHOCT domain-containing protein n=1 Tax=Thermotomaculum hydrothermale TaxID=981385 RepID=A0A7R6PPX2_9BACT|nr:hypothetical protein [Thermotomaculum hydrothermale]BBB33653.1 hypothetical protein TTHT_2229 [Thermotomaculum hydrothermale]